MHRLLMPIRQLYQSALHQLSQLDMHTLRSHHLLRSFSCLLKVCCAAWSTRLFCCLNSWASR